MENKHKNLIFPVFPLARSYDPQYYSEKHKTIYKYL